jgi:hypothetical protein
MVKLGVSAGQYVVSADSSANKAKKLRIPTSIDTLSPQNRFVRTMNKLPIADHIPYHSIIGDRGRGDTPNSSDGVVPYWSSHLDGAQSERIVPSGHPAHQNKQGMEEVDRILRLNLRNANGKDGRAQSSLIQLVTLHQGDALIADCALAHFSGGCE